MATLESQSWQQSASKARPGSAKSAVKASPHKPSRFRAGPRRSPGASRSRRTCTGGLFAAPDKAIQDMTVAQLLDRYVAEEAVHKASGSDDGQRAGTLKRALGGYGA